MAVKLCDGLRTADNGLVFDRDSQNYTLEGIYTSNNCPDKCDNDDKKISSAFIGLLKFYKDFDNMKNLESDKIAEYAILWLGHKLNQKKKNGTTTLNEFYNNHIKKNSFYNNHLGTDSDSNIKMGVIDTKIESMNMNMSIKDISNFYEVFKLLCRMDNELDTKKKTQCNKCLENAEEFFEKCEKLKNALNINKGSPYFQLLYSLSNDYDKFKEKYKKVCSDIKFLETCSRSSVTESLVKECQVTESPVTECPVTKNTLITIAIIFVAASILLGVSYKYSLFVFRKRAQKQHLREKLKK
ncbi:hypothetical protein YYC_02128 [Plasmodium yoelii 17X]|uniref:YIR protein n=1 Tax=Plasmodium yoelii 17X TaxID=1323249 RepID=V7PPE3_PLAYE|nr:hypothetical protein YYC_02128 [Plasmodium yoelii 17X]